MATTVKTQVAQITCINKADRLNPHERITHIGGSSGSGWKLTQEDAIGRIKRREWDFFVSVNGKSVWVVVATSRYGHEYLKTEADADEPNNLLSLPECR